MPGSAPGTNRYEKNGFVEPLPALFPAIPIPGHDGSPDAHLTVLLLLFFGQSPVQDQRSSLPPVLRTSHLPVLELRSQRNVVPHGASHSRSKAFGLLKLCS